MDFVAWTGWVAWQAFKAANPLCVLEDFIRWHSPRDWLVEGAAPGGAAPGGAASGGAAPGGAAPEGTMEGDGATHMSMPRGRLSQRMSSADSLWQQARQREPMHVT